MTETELRRPTQWWCGSTARPNALVPFGSTADFGSKESWILAAFTPLGVGLLADVLAKPFIEASQRMGRYYGAVADDVIATLKGLSDDPPTLSKVVGTLSLLHLGGTAIPGAAAVGFDAWSITKDLGAKLGEVAEDGIGMVVDAVGDVAEAGSKFVGDALDWIGIG